MAVTTTHASHILTVPEVAAELRCCKSHVHNLINGAVKGLTPLPALALGRRRLVRRETLENWLRSNEHDATLESSPRRDAVDAWKEKTHA